MRTGILLLVFLVSSNLAGQGIISNGYNKFYYPNGQISSEGYMKNGKPDGYWKTYYVTGVLKSEGKRINHLLDSVWIFYNQVGDIIEKINFQYGKKSGYYYTYKYDSKNSSEGYIASKELYINDKKEGSSSSYYSENRIHRTINYVNGKKQGIAFEYSENGTIISILEYHNNYLFNREKVNRADNNSLKQGIWKEFSPDGKIHFERTYLDDQLNGYYKEYDRNGNLIFAIRYENGKIINEKADETDEIEIRNTYDENGILVASGPFKENVPVGIHRKYRKDGNVTESTIYNDSGRIISTGIVNEKGEKEGDWTDFYPTGEKRDEGKYTNNKKSGTWKFYRLNGTVEQVGNYRNDRINGLWKWYYPNGYLLREEEYFLGKEDGLSVEYSDSADVIAKGEYINGEKEGEWYYNAGGDQIEKGNYITGLRENIWKYYFINGKLKYSGSYRQGLPDGKHKYFYENGLIKEEQYYEMGLRQKNWKKYDQDGNIILSISYKDDIEKRINGVKINLKEDIKRIK